MVLSTWSFPVREKNQKTISLTTFSAWNAEMGRVRREVIPLMIDHLGQKMAETEQVKKLIYRQLS